jgi:hypothetical protein
MNREEAKQVAEIVKAYAEGRELEVQLRGELEDRWVHTSAPQFNFVDLQYRVKPEPRTFYALEGTKKPGVLFCLSSTREEAERYRKAHVQSEEIKVVSLVEKL